MTAWGIMRTEDNIRIALLAPPTSTFHDFSLTSSTRPTTRSPTSPRYRDWSGSTLTSLFTRSTTPHTDATSVLLFSV